MSDERAVKAAGLVLMQRGHYPDSVTHPTTGKVYPYYREDIAQAVELMRADAEGAAAAALAGRYEMSDGSASADDPVGAVALSLFDHALHDPTYEDDRACAQADAVAICEMLGLLR